MSERDLTPEQKRCKEIVIENRGWWTELFDDILKLDPEWIAIYSAFSAHPAEVLDPKLKEFIHVAVDAITTKLFTAGTRFHMEKAFDQGATVEELVEVIELTVNAGIYSTLIEGVELLAEESDGPEMKEESTDERDRLKREFEDAFGYWTPLWDDVAAFDPEHFEHMVTLFSHPWERGPLNPKEKELIMVATSITASHLYSRGARIHIRRALEVGASSAEVLATIQTASVVGQHTTDEAMPILMKLADERGLL